jgi:hypothetical protein
MTDDTDGCPGTNRKGEPCGHPEGYGTDHDSGPCKYHGGASPRGSDHPSFKHGAFSEYLESDLTDDEKEALAALSEDLGDPDEARQRIREQAAEAYLKYKRSGDERFLREYRQLLSTFNIVEAPEQVEVEHSGEIDGERTLELGDDMQDAVREVLRQRRGGDE